MFFKFLFKRFLHLWSHMADDELFRALHGHLADMPSRRAANSPTHNVNSPPTGEVADS